VQSAHARAALRVAARFVITLQRMLLRASSLNCEAAKVLKNDVGVFTAVLQAIRFSLSGDNFALDAALIVPTAYQKVSLVAPVSRGAIVPGAGGEPVGRASIDAAAEHVDGWPQSMGPEVWWHTQDLQVRKSA
jgi:hypothetical protein